MITLNEIKAKEIAEGILGKYAHGKNMTLGWLNIKAGSTLPLHQHPHEQITLMIEGKMEFCVGEEKCMLEPGVIKIIPSNMPHSAYAHTDCILIDVFNPVREDYRV
ncbi:MAG: cupin domain-containing protein [bacterium]|jgi:quercetin dioxygenase-like cupin family protein